MADGEDMLRRMAWVILALGIVSLTETGCIEKTILPTVMITVAKVEPYDLVPTSTATADLPTVQITLDFETQVPTNLVSFSIAYQSKVGQALPELAIPTTPYEFKFTPAAGQTITISPYTRRVVDLYELSPSDLSPILATIRLTFEDANGNTLTRDATCRLFKP